MPSSVCKLHLSHIRRAVVYPPRRRISAAPSYIRRASFAPCLQIDHDTTNPARVWIAAEARPACGQIVRRGRRAGWNPHIFYFWPFFQRLRKSAMNTRAVTQENELARAREIFAPRFPKNFPKNFRVSFSRFVFAFRFFSESEFTL